MDFYGKQIPDLYFPFLLIALLVMKNKFSVCCLAVLVCIAACKKDKTETPAPVLVNTIPEFYKAAVESDYGMSKPDFVQIANSGSQLDIPQDLDFHPARPNEMWIVNKGTEATGGSVVIINNPGETNQSYVYKVDGNAWHFMSMPSALSFSNNGNFATTENVLDANHQGGRYTGPALWSSNLNIFAQPSGGNGSHIDMVHQSPYSMGIEAEKDNAFWVFDGYYGNIIRYDFVADHGPGNDYHADAKLRRYTEVKVKRDPEVPSHLVLDGDKKWLYIVDGGNSRILRMDITTGTVLNSLPPIDEPLAEYSRMNGVTWEIYFDQNLQKPCGIELKDKRLFVSDYETGDIICFDIQLKKEIGRVHTGKPGITGIKIYNGKLWYVNAMDHTCGMVRPK